MLDQTITIRNLELKSRLVMPPMHTGLATEDGRATEALADYYHERAEHSAPGLIIMEHTCITEAGRASKTQLSIAADDRIDDHRKLTDAIHTAGGRVFLQLNHAGAAAQPRAPMQREPKKAPAVQGKPARGAPGCIARHGGDRGRLEGLRDLIWASLEEASPADVARLAPEYRKTIEEIERMGGDDGKQAREAPGGAADGLAEILSL